MSGKSNKSPAGAILALLILVIIVVALIFILRGGGDDENEDLNAPPAEAGEVSDAPSQPSEGEDEDDVNVPTPPAESPVQESAAPTPTPTPTPMPTPTPTPTPAVSASSGSFRSDTGTGLNIVVDWTLTPGASGATLAFTVSTESYSLYNNGAWHALSVQVGGSTYEFDTEAISCDGPGLETNELSTGTIQLSSSDIPAAVTVNWHFQGSYGGTELETISASGTVS